MVDCMEKCTRSSNGLFLSHLHFDHCVHHCEKKCNGNHPHHPKEPKPDHPHYPKEPKSSYEDKMVDCMEKCTRSSHGLFFSHLHFDHCVHHCEKKCNKPTYPHHPMDPYKPTYPYHPEAYSHHHNGPKHRSCLANCIDICDEDSSLGRMSQGFKLKKLKKVKLLKAKVLKKKLLKKVLLKKVLKKKLLKKKLLKKKLLKKLLKKVLLKKVLKKKLLKKKLLKKKLL